MQGLGRSVRRACVGFERSSSFLCKASGAAFGVLLWALSGARASYARHRAQQPVPFVACLSLLELPMKCIGALGEALGPRREILVRALGPCRGVSIADRSFAEKRPKIIFFKKFLDLSLEDVSI